MAVVLTVFHPSFQLNTPQMPHSHPCYINPLWITLPWHAVPLFPVISTFTMSASALPRAVCQVDVPHPESQQGEPMGPCAAYMPDAALHCPHIQNTSLSQPQTLTT